MAIAVFFAEGYEEIEALTVVDLTRRAGIETWMVSITEEKKVTGSHGIEVSMDKTLAEVDFNEVDMIVLPGGMPGTLNLEACEPLMEKVKEFDKAGKYISAICAAPTVFGHLGLLEGKKACCYPGMEDGLENAEVTYNSTAVAEHILTSRGMGTAIDFGLQIIAAFQGSDAAEDMAKKIVYK
ncbi:MAG: DJ-1/PfpI family protein [Lachnospiraceae bacterium]|nr:DJ-1/PfpI family protein [Lachnospiraceae bacterium]